MADQVTAPAIETDLAVSRAAAAARRGELDAAAQVLTAVAEEHPATLDLLARIRAQQGRWREADEHWARVQAIDPGHAGAAEGRRVLSGILAGRRRPRPAAQPAVLAGSGAVLAVALLAGTVAVLADPSAAPSTAPSPIAVATVTVAPDEDRRRAEELARRLAVIEADRSAAAERLAARLDAISGRLTMPGVIVKRRPDAVEVYFRDGLFAQDTRLTAAGAALLADVGSRLGALDASVTVVGHSVPGQRRRASGGSGVALARAQVAALGLAEAGDLPLTAFTLRSADQSNGPFKEAARNRTASLVLTPA